MSILLGLFIGAPFISALLWRTATLGSHSFWELFAYAPKESAMLNSRVGLWRRIYQQNFDEIGA